MESHEPVASTSNAPVAAALNASEGPPVLSKNQQRKQRRQAALDATKHERRAREKARRKESKAAKRKLVEEEGADPFELGLKKRRINQHEKKKFETTVVVDLSFDDKMMEKVRLRALLLEMIRKNRLKCNLELLTGLYASISLPNFLRVQKEIKSMSTQINHCYNINRHSPNPVNLVFTPLDGKLRDRMDNACRGVYKRWKSCRFSEAPLEMLWSTQVEKRREDDEHNAIEQQENGASKTATAATRTLDQPLPNIEKNQVIYLTADSPNTLSELEEGKAYIIGGIVDHNRYKNLCYDYAKTSGVQHAALPIGEYIQMASRRVLTVNQCYEIMMKWLEHRDWEKAFYEVIPKRKFEESEKARKKREGREKGSASLEQEGTEEEEEEENEDEAENEDQVEQILLQQDEEDEDIQGAEQVLSEGGGGEINSSAERPSA